MIFKRKKKPIALENKIPEPEDLLRISIIGGYDDELDIEVEFDRGRADTVALFVARLMRIEPTLAEKIAEHLENED